MSLAGHARARLLDLFCRLVTGEPIVPAEGPEVREKLRLFGFRKTARDFLIRRLAPAAAQDGGLTMLAPALDGLFHVALSGTDLGVGWEILRKGTYEPHLVAFYRSHLRAGMTVADIGANIGFHALHAARCVGSEGRVIAIEPDPGNVALLRLSLSLPGNDLPVELIQGALSDHDGELVLSDLGNAGNSGARFTHPDREHLETFVHGSNPRFETTQAFRWDGRFGDRRIDFVKIDIEGFEPRAMAGMEESLARFHPLVVSEFAPGNLSDLGGVQPIEYLQWFEARGYRYSLISEPEGNLATCSPEQLIEQAHRQHHVDIAFLYEGSG
jgi:FkbM family methyltransferase